MTSAAPFMGREDELRMLRQGLFAAAGGSPAFLLIAGPAGIGKSRLLAEFAREAALGAPTGQPATTVVWADGRRGALPLGLWSTLARLLHDAGPDEGVGTRLDEGLDPARANDIGDATDRVRVAIGTVAGTVVIALDDLHLADDASLRVLCQLLERPGAARLLVVGAVRRPTEIGQVRVTLPEPDVEVPLAGLRSSDVRRLIGDRLDALGPAQADRYLAELMSSTGGNPLRVVAGLANLRSGDDPAPTGDALAAALDSLPADVRRTLTVMAVAPGLRDHMLLQHTGLTQAEVSTALLAASEAGLIGVSLTRGPAPLHARVAELLLDRLLPEERADLDRRIGRSLRSDQGASPLLVAHHLLPVAALLEPTEVVDIALRAGDEALSRLAYGDADQLFATALEALRKGPPDPQRQLVLLLRRARARQRLGDLAGTSDIAAAAARLASSLDEPDALAEAAVLHAFPPDWRRWSEQSAQLLADADNGGASLSWQARVLASRSRVEMRVPTAIGIEEEWAWSTRPTIARPMAERALELARASGDPIALVESLLAWRSNHRAPQFLARRRAATLEALNLAHRHAEPTLLFEAALRHALDCLEEGDRAAIDEQFQTLTFVAERTGEVRLRWRTLCVAAMLAGLDGDLDGLARRREEATALASGQQFQGRKAAQLIQTAYELLQRSALAPFEVALREGHPVIAHPLGIAGAARVAAGLGDDATARGLLKRLRSSLLDEETSLLATLTSAGWAAVALGDVATSAWAHERLMPWTDRCALDSEGLWPAEPVALVASELSRLLGEPERARHEQQEARRIATRLRSRSALEALRRPRRETDGSVEVSGTGTLTARQLAVLARLAAGLTNEAIATELHVSRATAVREVGAIYRLLGAANRAEAVRLAASLSLLPG
jgi:DNA-binding CsgD family transcriptional regulator